MSVPAVSSALHRARAAAPRGGAALAHEEPPAAVLRAYVRCWETRDLDGLLALLRKDVVFTMPPWPLWFRGRAAVGRFLASARFHQFWDSGVRVRLARANGQVGLVFYRDHGRTLHSLQLARFAGGAFAEVVTLIGAHNLHGFRVPRTATERFRRPRLS